MQIHTNQPWKNCINGLDKLTYSLFSTFDFFNNSARTFIQIFHNTSHLLNILMTVVQRRNIKTRTRNII